MSVIRSRAEPLSTIHPVDVLIAEHDVILAVCDAMAREAMRAERGEVRASFWDGALRFVGDFADRRHHGKEEDLLFPALAEAGMPRDRGPVAVMLCEHTDGRALAEQMAHALAAADGPRLATLARSYVLLLREHIAKENEVLFEMARDALPPERAQSLRHDFERFDGSQGEIGDSALVARQLCAQAAMD